MSRILVIDDDADQLVIRRLILEHAGYEVFVARTEDEARTAFAAGQPEIVLVDLRLEREGAGLDLIREFRASERAVRIVVLSGWAHDLAGKVATRRSIDDVRKGAYAAFGLVISAGLTVKFAWDRWGWGPRPVRPPGRYPLLFLGALGLAHLRLDFADLPVGLDHLQVGQPVGGVGGDHVHLAALERRVEQPQVHRDRRAGSAEAVGAQQSL